MQVERSVHGSLELIGDLVLEYVDVLLAAQLTADDDVETVDTRNR